MTRKRKPMAGPLPVIKPRNPTVAAMLFRKQGDQTADVDRSKVRRQADRREIRRCVAQLAEHPAFTRRVVRSTRTAPTTVTTNA